MKRLQGCGTALVTPFTEPGKVDFPALRALVDWQIAEGIDFLVACGSTGEAQTLDEGERERVAAAVVEVSAGRVPVMAGATSNDTARAVDETRRMCHVGVDYIRLRKDCTAISWPWRMPPANRCACTTSRAAPR
jgi:4-hydroxy-tetrahydrodipicolinate synthase